MSLLKKNKEKEKITPPDNPPHVPQTRHQRLVNIMDIIWKPYKNESDEFNAEIQHFQKFKDLVYTIYRKHGSRKQWRLLEEFFIEDRLPREDTDRSRWVQYVGSKIFEKPILSNELELSPMLTLLSKFAWLKALDEDAKGLDQLKDQRVILPPEYHYFLSLLRPHLDDPDMWFLREKICGANLWELSFEPSDAAKTHFVIRAFKVLQCEKGFQRRVMASLLH